MNKFLIALIIMMLSSLVAFGQNEQAPMQEKDIVYKDWTYKSINGDQELNLRDFTKGKKLVMVVYYAPWCPNWAYDAPMLQRLYEKYRAAGLGIVAVGLYDPVASMKANAESIKVTFPIVYENEARDSRLKTRHYEYRTAVGDTRKWGSPWYIFLNPATIEPKGDVITKRTHIINGELIEKEGEQFIRRALGLPAADGAK